MFQRHKVFLLAVSLAGWQSANASACINGHPSVADEYAASFDVVEARVAVIKRDVPHFSYVYKGEVVSSDLDMFDAVTLHITRSYKHRVSGSITINNPHSTAAFPVDPGGTYLVFLRARAPSGEIIVDTCGSSRSMSRISTETLRALNELAGTGGRAGK